jgi:dsRNA-specific ribonuclease
MANLSHWSIPDLPDNLVLPPLPTLNDPTTREQVFTHASLHGQPRRATDFNLDDQPVIGDYEKLEHVGDAILGISHSYGLAYRH